MINFLKLNKISLTFLLFLFVAGIHFCFKNNYGWDWDSYAMIDTYLNILENGSYSRSRGAGYIIPEIGIGFLSYYFGSFIVNFFSFLFLIAGLIFLYQAITKILEKDLVFGRARKNEMMIVFLLLCLTNHIVFRDSTIPMDYSWSFLFYSMGFYFITRKQIEWSIIFFSLCFGSRFNFIVFILPTIFFLDKYLIDNKKKLLVTLIIATYGGLFYLPSWLQSSFSLNFVFSSDWYNAFKPAPILSLEEFARFFHKITNTFGLLFLVGIIYMFITNNIKIFTILKNYNLAIILILINFLVFFFFPWEPSFLWVSIFLLNFILITSLKKKFLYLLIFINFFNWFYEAKIIQVNYINNSCYKQPTTAKFKFHFDKGIMLNIQERLDHAKCYPDLLGDKKITKYKLQIQEGKRLIN